jgi:hypothetical protein
LRFGLVCVERAQGVASMGVADGAAAGIADHRRRGIHLEVEGSDEGLDPVVDQAEPSPFPGSRRRPRLAVSRICCWTRAFPLREVLRLGCASGWKA